MNDFDGQEPGTIESILKFTKETYGANFEIFDKVNFQDRWSFWQNSAWGSIEMLTIRKTQPTLILFF